MGAQTMNGVGGKKLNPMGWVRLVIYILSSLVGLAAVVVNTLGYSDLGVMLGTVAGAAAAITGGTATYNLPAAPDNKGGKLGGIDLAAALPALFNIGKAAEVYVKQSQAEPSGRHALEESATPGAAAVGGDEAYLRDVRGV